VKKVAELDEITMESIKTIHKVQSSVKKIKLIGAGAKDLASKIKDENVLYSGMNK
jgi:large subunit ribosomal protein L15